MLGHDAFQSGRPGGGSNGMPPNFHFNFDDLFKNFDFGDPFEGDSMHFSFGAGHHHKNHQNHHHQGHHQQHHQAGHGGFFSFDDFFDDVSTNCHCHAIKT